MMTERARLQERVRLMEQVNLNLCEKIRSLGLEMEDLKVCNTILKKMSHSQSALIIQRCWRRHLLIKRIKEKSRQYRIFQIFWRLIVYMNSKPNPSPCDTFLDRRDFFLRKLRN
jgi:hypothetical protein